MSVELFLKQMADINDFKYTESLHNAIFGSGKNYVIPIHTGTGVPWVSENPQKYFPNESVELLL